MKILDYITNKMVKELYELGEKTNNTNIVFYCINWINSFINKYTNDENQDIIKLTNDEISDIVKECYTHSFNILKEYNAIKEGYNIILSKPNIYYYLKNNRDKYIKIVSLDSYVRSMGSSPLIFKDSILSTKHIFDSYYIIYDESNASTESSVILFGATNKDSENLFYITDTESVHGNAYNLTFTTLKFSFESVLHTEILTNSKYDYSSDNDMIEYKNECIFNLLTYLRSYNSNYMNFRIDFIDIDSSSDLTLKIIDSINSNSKNIDDRLDRHLSKIYDLLYEKYINLNVDPLDVSQTLYKATKTAYETIVNELAFKYNIEDLSILTTSNINNFIHE